MSNEVRYYDALKRISKYLDPERLLRQSEKEYGLSYGEALEMAYDNIRQEAKVAVGRKRRPSTETGGVK